jgi:hypothetical protein
LNKSCLVRRWFKMAPLHGLPRAKYDIFGDLIKGKRGKGKRARKKIVVGKNKPKRR